MGKTPHSVCNCKTHENMINYLNTIHKYEETIATYNSDFLTSVVCDVNDTKCTLNECEACKDGKMFAKNFPLSDKGVTDLPVEWWKWDTADKRVVKLVEQGKVSDLYNSIVQELGSFVQHCFIKKQQAISFETDKIHLDGKNAVIQMDFSENYTCQWQNEVQSAHWHQTQVTVFTVAIWTKPNKPPQSHIYVSDNLDHDKQSIAVFVDMLLSDLKSKSPEIDEVSFWTDGPSSQFKNRYIVSLINFLKLRHTLTKMHWNYFATSHGKGPVDGIGGLRNVVSGWLF